MAATRGRSGSKAKKSGGKAMAKSKSGSRSKTSAKRGSSKSKTGSRTASKSASSAKTAARKRGSGKRDLLNTPTGNFFAHRDGEGQFTEMDEMGRSLAADRRKKAKTKVASGYGDRGDR